MFDILGYRNHSEGQFRPREVKLNSNYFYRSYWQQHEKSLGERMFLSTVYNNLFSAFFCDSSKAKLWTRKVRTKNVLHSTYWI